MCGLASRIRLFARPFAAPRLPAFLDKTIPPEDSEVFRQKHLNSMGYSLLERQPRFFHAAYSLRPYQGTISSLFFETYGCSLPGSAPRPRLGRLEYPPA